ncbi:MAG: phage tail fiber protein [Candidatus Thorarchaeota archaeon]|jgi:hypothetical protein
MSQFSDYTEPKVLDAIFNNVAFGGPNSMYVALYTVTPTDVTASGTEVTGGSYARIKVQRNAGSNPKWNLAVNDTPGSAVDNLDTITFATATASWGNVVAFAIYDQLTTGNQLMWGPLTNTKTVNNNDTFKFLAGDLNLRCE